MPDSPSFDLVITAVESRFSAHVHSAFGVGELPPQEFVLPLDPSTLARQDDVEDWVMHARIVRRSVANPELEKARALGSALFEQLFSGELLACFRASRSVLPPDQVLRLRLRLPPALTALPWELLYDPRDDQFLALAPDVVLLRYPQVPTSISPLPVEGALQVVIVVARPGDLPLLDVESELHRITSALEGPTQRGRLVLDIIRGPDTLVQLQARLRRPAHIVHFIGHGTIDEANGEGVLIFEDLHGKMEPINAELLRMQFQKQRGQTRLVVLNACLGALPAGRNPFSSVGAALMRGGVPAVLAMQFAIPDEVGVDLARVFYTELAAGTPVDVAVNETRMQLYGRNPYRLDWVIPVLFLRADDGALFNLAGHETASAPFTLPVQDAATDAAGPVAAPQVVEPALPNRTSKRRRFPLVAWLLSALILLAILLLFRDQLPGLGLSASGSAEPGFAGGRSMGAAPIPTGTSPEASTIGSTATTGGRELSAPVFATAAPTAQPLAGLNVSNTPGRSDYAELALDGAGIAHVVWLDNTPRQGKADTMLHRQLVPDGTWADVEDWTPEIEYLGETTFVRNAAGKLCMLNHSVAGLYSRCNMNGTWSAIQGPESMGTTNAFSPAIDAEGNLHWISGLNEMKFQGVTLDDGLADVTHPVLAIDTDGGYHAMWQRSGTPYSIEYRYSSDAGKTWQPAERLSDPEGEFAEYPALAADGVGGIHLVWWENPRVWYRYWTKATGWGKPVELGRGVSSGIPVVTIDAKNRAHVVWQRDLNVYYVQQMQDGSWRPPRLLTVLKDHLGTGPRVVVDSRDVRHFVWADQGNDGARDIFYAALPPE